MKTIEEEINAAIDLLRGQGYSVTKPVGDFHWETPGEFLGRTGLSNAHFSRRTKEPECPFFKTRQGESGRILLLMSNPDFEAWMRPRRHSEEPTARRLSRAELLAGIRLIRSLVAEAVSDDELEAAKPVNGSPPSPFAPPSLQSAPSSPRPEADALAFHAGAAAGMREIMRGTPASPAGEPTS